MGTQEGMVIEVIGSSAKIKIGKHNDCINCGACPGENSVIVTSNNKIGAKPGQRVVIEVKETNALKAAFVVFILPLIVVFLGVVAGGLVGKMLGANVTSSKILGGIISFLLVITCIKLFDNSVNKNEKSIPVIIRILK